MGEGYLETIVAKVVKLVEVVYVVRVVEVYFDDNVFSVAFFLLVVHTARPSFTTVGLYSFLCIRCNIGTGTPPVPKPKTIFGYQNIITVTVSRLPPEYISVVTKKVPMSYPPVCRTITSCT